LLSSSSCYCVLLYNIIIIILYGVLLLFGWMGFYSWLVRFVPKIKHSFNKLSGLFSVTSSVHRELKTAVRKVLRTPIIKIHAFSFSFSFVRSLGFAFVDWCQEFDQSRRFVVVVVVVFCSVVNGRQQLLLTINSKTKTNKNKTVIRVTVNNNIKSR
jgi:hypothetical protein